MKNTKKFTNIEVIFLVVVTSIVSLLMGYDLSANKSTSENKNSKELTEFINTYNKIKENYYKEIDDKEVLNGAVNGMLSTLDKHSVLVDKEEDENFYLTLAGSYNGIGIEIVRADDDMVIIGVIENSPAYVAGLKAGDIVKKVDDIDLHAKDTKVLSNYIRKESTKDEYHIKESEKWKEIEFSIMKKSDVVYYP